MLSFLLMFIAVGVAIGFATKGKANSLRQLSFQSNKFIFAALFIQILSSILMPHPSNLLRWVVVATTYLLALIWLLKNLRSLNGAIRNSLLVISAGWLLNTIAIVANGGMPVSTRSLRGAHITVAQATRGQLDKHVIVGHAHLQWLGDFIPIARLHSVISLGDVLLAAGIAGLVASGMHKPQITHLEKNLAAPLPAQAQN